MLLALGLWAVGQVAPGRFQTVAPFPRLPWIKVDRRYCAGSFADESCRNLNLQGRVMWIDGTANLNAISSASKIESLLKELSDLGFNTVVLDVKPIVGRTLYPSKLADQMTSWKGQAMPAGFDPVKVFRRVTKTLNLSFLVSLNAFSEGHQYANREAEQTPALYGKPGWGYEHKELQSVQLDGKPELYNFVNPDQAVTVNSRPNVEVPRAVVVWTTKPPKKEGVHSVRLDSRGFVLEAADEVATTFNTGETTIVDYSGGSTLDWMVPGVQVKVRVASSTHPTSEDQNQIPLMMNPHEPKVQERLLSFVREVVSDYHPDGLLFDDRFRFAGLDADFSSTAKKDFEKVVGHPVNWPSDVYSLSYSLRLERGIKPGPLFDAWLAFRAETLAKAVKAVRKEIKAADPATRFGIYAGSWYGDYSKYGSNYASDALQAGFPFLTRAYRNAGFASELDLLITGCYYKTATMVSAMERGKPVGQTVEAAADVSNRVARDKCWVYAGIQLADFWDDPQQVQSALQAAAACTQGVMVFDYSHKLDLYKQIFKRAFERKALAPHMQDKVLLNVRSKRRKSDAKGYKERPFPILEGAPGAGF